MDTHLGLWATFIFLAAVVGFFADRASFCTVKAVEEILTTRRAYMIVSFAKTVLWVTGITIWLVWWLGLASPTTLSFGISGFAILGGLLFGVGAALNDGCAISTVTRLGNGNLGMLVSLLGICAGIAIFALVENTQAESTRVPTAPIINLQIGSATAVGIALTTWMVWEVVRLYRSVPMKPWWKGVFARPLRLSGAAAVIGVSNGILYAHLGTWSYTNTLKQGVAQIVSPQRVLPDSTPGSIYWVLLVALLLGVVVSAAIDRYFTIAWRPSQDWLGYFSGGLLMGIGAGLIPGGNDVLLLNAIPGLSPHAVPSFLAILLGIWLVLIVKRRFAGELKPVNCSGDRCYAPARRRS